MGPPPHQLAAALAVSVVTAAGGQDVARPGDEVVLGKPSAILQPAAPAESVLVAAGTRLHTLPDRRSALIDVVGADAPRPVLERAAGWVLVRIDGQGGWAAVADGRTGPGIEAPADLEFLSVRAEPLAPEAERLARARELLGDDPGRPIGPFFLYTDVDDGAAVARITDLITRLPAAYAGRYGLEPAPRDRFALVVFRDEATYRAFERRDAELADLRASGHASGNIAAIYAEGRGREELAPILLHELTHLLNQSVFRGGLPPWLEEGMAEDLSFARIDAAGRIDPRRLGGVDRRYVELSTDGSRTYITELWGAPAALSRLVDASRANRLTALPDLMTLSRREMLRFEGRPLRYGQSAFLVRYLLDGAGNDGRNGFRRFLRRAAEGEGAEPDELLDFVEKGWEELARGWARWLVNRERALDTAG